MKKLFLILFLSISEQPGAQFAPAVGQAGTTAIHKDSSVFVAWATTVWQFNPGPQDISNGVLPLVNSGNSTAALYLAEGNSNNVVSLGDGGSIVLSFLYPIKNGPGSDFAVFENSFSHDFLELAHVEVSSDGINFVRFPSQSLIQNMVQTTSFGASLAEEVHNLAGKYIQAYGTPFDLEDVSDSLGINVDSINYVRLVDVVGSIEEVWGTEDGLGNLINDPFPTPFGSGGFDLDAIGVIHENNPFATINQPETWFKVYPNPSSGQIKVEFEGPQNVVIYDPVGTIIFEEVRTHILELDLGELGWGSGVYFIKIRNKVLKIWLAL